MRFFTQPVRLAVSVGTLFCGCWGIVKIAERSLTPLIIDASLEALRESDVQEEIYELFTKLVTRLLDHPTSRDRTVDFLKQVIKSHIVEDAVRRSSIETLHRAEFEAQGLDLMRNVAHFVVKHRHLLEASHDLLTEMLKSMRYIELVRQIRAIHNANYKMPTYDSYKVLNIDVREIVQEQVDFLQTFELKQTIQYFLSTQVIEPHRFRVLFPHYVSINTEHLLTRDIEEFRAVAATHTFAPAQRISIEQLEDFLVEY